MLDRMTLRKLYAVLVLCLALRVGLSIYWMDADVPQEAHANVRIGQCLADGRGFSIDPTYGEGDLTGKTHLTAYRNPIYPAFLGVVYSVIGEDIGGVPSISIVQSVVDTLTCFLVFLFALRMLGRPKAALVAAVLYCVYLPVAASVTVPMPETLAALFTLLAAYLLVRAIGGETRQYAFPGAVMGFLILLRPAMLLFPFAVAIILLIMRRRTPGWIWKAAVYIGMAYLVVSPWTYRNYRVFHALVPVAAQAGNTLWAGTGPADGVYLGAWNFRVASVSGKRPSDNSVPVVSEQAYRKIINLQDRLGQMNEVQLDRALVSEAQKEIKQHPGSYAFLAVKKFFRLWFNLWDDSHASWGTYAIAVLNAVLLALAVLGYRRAKVDYRVKLVSLYLCAYVTIVSMLTFSCVRYSYPVMPMVLILVAAYVGKIFDSGSSRSRLVIKVK